MNLSGSLKHYNALKIVLFPRHEENVNQNLKASKLIADNTEYIKLAEAITTFQIAFHFRCEISIINSAMYICSKGFLALKIASCQFVLRHVHIARDFIKSPNTVTIAE